jgi:hypothetical protein
VIMRKPIAVAVFIFAVFIATGIVISRCPMESNASATTVWQQFKRRLFDDDVPRETQPSPKQHDMTGI